MSAIDRVHAVPVASLTTFEAADPWVRITLEGESTALAGPTRDSPARFQNFHIFQ
jgi:hypothetical protein